MLSGPCPNCLHPKTDSDSPLRCLAFLDDIPEEIVTGRVDHSKPYTGDHALRYEPLLPDNEP